jgi:hypothetical protein
VEVRAAARKNYRLWQDNAFHSSLHFKSIGQPNWSVRIGTITVPSVGLSAMSLSGNGSAPMPTTTSGFDDLSLPSKA